MSLINSIKTRFVVWVWNHTPTCTEMSRLASRSLDEPLTVGTHLKMRWHFVICAWCQRYFKQIHFLHAAAPQLGQLVAESTVNRMSGDAKLRITHSLRLAAGKAL